MSFNADSTFSVNFIFKIASFAMRLVYSNQMKFDLNKESN